MDQLQRFPGGQLAVVFSVERQIHAVLPAVGECGFPHVAAGRDQNDAVIRVQRAVHDRSVALQAVDCRTQGFADLFLYAHRFVTLSAT